MDRPTYLRKRRTPSDESEGIVWRLVAALVAIPVFEISLYLGTYLVFPSRDLAYLLMAIPLWMHAVYAGAAAVVGLVFGFKGITWLLGHLFLTHHENEQNKVITFLLWGGFLGLAFVASHYVA
ncbi:hypothetical protein SAMN05216350_10425 [Polaromonas sp. YR568]|uniref:hypothetical protein n=1 Tax=Polaromonas sp. YR568 TaxID=1855301 RepID=UPI0008F28574|nr:hypothetical protein [Polaromonas sp. YR568]SFU70122.1 hypothetical protein SAMN05216350_10425 [Polaromonas sp. YR568]